MRLAKTQAHGKADEYAAALEEVKTRQPILHSTHLQRLMLGLLGNPLRAKMAKEATSILKGMSCPRFLPRVPKPGDRFAAPLHTWSSVALARCGGTLHVIVGPDVVATHHVDVGANNRIWIFVKTASKVPRLIPNKESISLISLRV